MAILSNTILIEISMQESIILHTYFHFPYDIHHLVSHTHVLQSVCAVGQCSAVAITTVPTAHVTAPKTVLATIVTVSLSTSQVPPPLI
mgnify:FL=1